MTDAQLAEAYLEVLSQAASSAQLAEAYLETISANSDYHRVVMADSPGHLYMLNESSGTTLLDSSGNARHGTYSGGLPPTAADLPVSAPGRGKVLTQYAQYAQASNAAYFSTAAYTIEGVIQCSVTTDTIFLYSFDAYDPFTISITNTTVTLASRLSSLAQTSVAYSVNLLDGKPHHIAGTWDGTTMLLYIDGVQRGSAAMSGTLRDPSGQAIYIARSSTGNTTRSYGAVAYYPAALSAARILAHYTAAMVGIFFAGTSGEVNANGSRTVTLTKTPLLTDSLLLIYSGGNTLPGMTVSGAATWGAPVGTSATDVSQFFVLGTDPTGTTGSVITVTDTAGSARSGSLDVYLVRGVRNPVLGSVSTGSTFGISASVTAQNADAGSVVFSSARGKSSQVWPATQSGDWHPSGISTGRLDQSGYALPLAAATSHATSLAVPAPSTSVRVSQIVLSPSTTAQGAVSMSAPSSLGSAATITPGSSVLWSSPPTSTVAPKTDGPISLGVQFKVTADGCTLRGFRFYQGTGAWFGNPTVALYQVGGSTPLTTAISPITHQAASSSNPVGGSTYTADKAFDGSNSTYALMTAPSVSVPQWLRASADPVQVTQYKVTPHPSSATYAPVDWKIQGSVDGSTWVDLDTQVGVTWPTLAQQSFSMSNTAAYGYYRMLCTKNGGATDYLGVAELTFVGLWPSPWATAILDTPYALTNGTNYRAAFLFPSNRPDAGPGITADIVNGALTVPKSANAVNGNDTYVYGASMQNPTTSAGSNYMLDMAVSPGAGSVAAGASLTAPSTLTSNATIPPSGSVALTAPSVLSGSATGTLAGAASLTAPSTLSATGTNQVQAAASLSAPSMLSAAAIVTRLGSAALTAPSSLTASASTNATLSGSAALTAPSTLGASTAGATIVAAAADLFAPSALAVSGVVAKDATVALTAPSVLVAGGTAILLPTATLSAQSVLTVSSVRTTFGAAVLLAGSTLSANGTRTVSALVAMMTASSVLAVAQIQMGAHVWNGTALVAGRIWVWDGTALVDPVTRKTWDGSALV